MKTLFLFRDSYEASYILSKLDKKRLIDGIILESGKNARNRKLKRIFSNSNFLLYPLMCLDILSLLLYTKWISRNLKKRLGKNKYPKDKIKLIVDDANEKKCLNFIRSFKPDLIFIFGTAILTKKMISRISAPILNIHDGILPLYRNVYSDFWAYNKEDYKNVGVCIFFVDPGIDSGDIALQKKINFKRNDSLIDLKVKNLTLIPDLVEEVVKRYSNKTLKRISQDNTKAFYHKSPTFINLLRFYLRSL